MSDPSSGDLQSQMTHLIGQLGLTDVQLQSQQDVDTYISMLAQLKAQSKPDGSNPSLEAQLPGAGDRPSPAIEPLS